MKKKHLIVFIFLILLDQITKLVISTNLELFESIPVIDGFFQILYVQNTGAAWSMLEGNMVFFYLITAVALAAMYYYYQHGLESELFQWGLILMMAGALGNFIDRLRLQYVVDFLSFDIFGYAFPVFNVADVTLCIGVGILFLDSLLESVGKKNEGK